MLVGHLEHGAALGLYPPFLRLGVNRLAGELGADSGVAGAGAYVLRFVDLREVNKPAR
jgi:hypothetical protein